MISIIIPAHNEAQVIAQTLAPLEEGIRSGELEVIVVCNGCEDNTEEVASRYPGVRCISAPVPSKFNALNLGEEEARSFPRIYLDADIVLSLRSIKALATALDTESCLAVAPRFEMDFSGASFMVKSYYEIWQKLPYVRKGMIGAGAYALSETGRRRFEKFPSLISDDGYVRALFKENERTVVKDAVSVVRAPRNFWGLVKIKTRSRLGVYELHKTCPELVANEEKSYRMAMSALLSQPRLWLKSGLYLAVNLVARFRAVAQRSKLDAIQWERDESSRN